MKPLQRMIAILAQAFAWKDSNGMMPAEEALEAIREHVGTSTEPWPDIEPRLAQEFLKGKQAGFDEAKGQIQALQERAIRAEETLKDAYKEGLTQSQTADVGRIDELEGQLSAAMHRIAELDQERIPIPAELHPDTAHALIKFAGALAIKLRKNEEKYGYSNGWLTEDWEEKFHLEHMAHIAKGDPRDNAIYNLFAWTRGWKTKWIVSEAEKSFQIEPTQTEAKSEGKPSTKAYSKKKSPNTRSKSAKAAALKRWGGTKSLPEQLADAIVPKLEPSKRYIREDLEALVGKRLRAGQGQKVLAFIAFRLGDAWSVDKSHQPHRFFYESKPAPAKPQLEPIEPTKPTTPVVTPSKPNGHSGIDFALPKDRPAPTLQEPTPVKLTGPAPSFGEQYKAIKPHAQNIVLDQPNISVAALKARLIELGLAKILGFRIETDVLNVMLPDLQKAWDSGTMKPAEVSAEVQAEIDRMAAVRATPLERAKFAAQSEFSTDLGAL